jgi:hypothetical protein
MGMLTSEELKQKDTVEDNPFKPDNEADRVLMEMAEEKEPFEKSQPGLSDAETIIEIDEGGYPNASQAQKVRSNDTAEFIVSMADTGLAVVFANYAKVADSKEFEADPEDRKRMAKYWGIYFQDKSVDMPPWVMALVITMIVISKKFNMAKQMREANLRAEAAEKEADELRKEMAAEKKRDRVESKDDQKA